MTHSITDAFKCNQCGAIYNSEHELREHQQSAHHAAANAGKPRETSEEEFVNQHGRAKGKSA